MRANRLGLRLEVADVHAQGVQPLHRVRRVVVAVADVDAARDRIALDLEFGQLLLGDRARLERGHEIEFRAFGGLLGAAAGIDLVVGAAP